MSASAATLASGTARHEPRSILFGRFMLPDTSEYPCQVAQLSPDGAVFVSTTTPPAGTSIVAYVDEIGRIEAVTGAPVEGGFEVSFQIAGTRRERIESRIRSLQAGDADAPDEPHTAHHDSEGRASHMAMPDGRVYACEVTDVSLTGAMVKTAVMPALGTSVWLGKMRGRIVRYLDTGVVVEFATQAEAAAPVNRTR